MFSDNNNEEAEDDDDDGDDDDDVNWLSVYPVINCLRRFTLVIYCLTRAMLSHL